MKTKKLVSLIMAGAMTLALAVPAFADVEGATVEVAATVTGASVNVVVAAPADGALVLNPYGLTLTGRDEVKQVYFTPLSIASTSNVALEVNAKVSGTVGTGITFATADFKTQPTTKQAFLYLAVGAQDTIAAYTAADYNAKNADQQIISTKEVTKTKMATLAITGDDATTYYTFVGSLSSAPATAWADDDTVSAKVVFDFKAVEAPATT